MKRHRLHIEDFPPEEPPRYKRVKKKTNPEEATLREIAWVLAWALLAVMLVVLGIAFFASPAK